MAFFSKVGGLLKQTVSRQLDSHLSPSNPSIFQAIRWMSSSKVFIGGLSYSTDETSLREAFARYGNVHDARVIIDRETGRSKGFGFITYYSSEEASSAIQALDGQELHGRRVRVAFATERPRTPRFDGGGSNYGGNYGGGGYGGGSGGYGGSGGAYDGGNYGGTGSNYGGNYGGGGQGGVDGYGSGGGSYGGGSFGTGGSPGGYNAGGYGGASGDSVGVASDASYSGGVGGNVTSDTSFASSGFGESFGLGNSGGSEELGTTAATSAIEDSAADFAPNEPVEQDDRDEDEALDDFSKRA